MSTRSKIAAAVLLLGLVGFLSFAVMALKSARTSCNGLPTVATVEAAMPGQELVRVTEAVNPGFVFVNVVPSQDCPGRSNLDNTYATQRDRQAIEAILSESTSHNAGGPFARARLFGIPYRLANT